MRSILPQRFRELPSLSLRKFWKGAGYAYILALVPFVCNMLAAGPVGFNAVSAYLASAVAVSAGRNRSPRRARAGMGGRDVAGLVA